MPSVPSVTMKGSMRPARDQQAVRQAEHRAQHDREAMPIATTSTG